MCENFLIETFSNQSSQTFCTAKNFYQVCKQQQKSCRILNDKVVHCFEKMCEVDSFLRYNIYCHNFDTLLASLPVNVEFSKKLAKSNQVNHEINQLITTSGAVVMYTDDSKTPLGVGSACYSPQAN